MENGTGPMPLSPSSSPRLPSPPPFTEVQIGPKSPIVGDSFCGRHDLGNEVEADSGALRRIRPGSKARDMASGPPLVPLSELDSAFQLQEHLKALHMFHTQSLDDDHTIALTKETATILATPPDGVEPGLWLYELTRFLTIKLNAVVVALFNDTPPCSAITCPEMRASEWQYLCAVHDPPKSCCAIDYCCHTLDQAAGILTSSKHFPSRLSLGMGSEGGGSRHQGERHLTSIFRRLYRIFAHSWFQHRVIFWQVEAEHGLYMFFKTVSDRYSLIPEDTYTIPPEAEGIEAEKALDESSKATFVMFKRHEDGGNGVNESLRDESTTDASMSTNTRRHKSNPSTPLLTTTMELPEDEEESTSVGGLPEEPASEDVSKSVEIDKSPIRIVADEDLQSEEQEGHTAVEQEEQHGENDNDDHALEESKSPELGQDVVEAPSENSGPREETTEAQKADIDLDVKADFVAESSGIA